MGRGYLNKKVGVEPVTREVQLMDMNTAMFMIALVTLIVLLIERKKE